MPSMRVSLRQGGVSCTGCECAQSVRYAESGVLVAPLYVWLSVFLRFSAILGIALELSRNRETNRRSINLVHWSRSRRLPGHCALAGCAWMGTTTRTVTRSDRGYLGAQEPSAGLVNPQ